MVGKGFSLLSGICFFAAWVPNVFLWLRETESAEGGSNLRGYSYRLSHIGPLPQLNEIMTEWGDWGPWTKCTRSCGDGIKSRTRACITKYLRVMPGSGIRTSHDRCTGESVQYEVCDGSQCHAGQESAGSFRDAQCRQRNNQRVLGRVVNSWIPYTQGVSNPCALVCEGEGEGIVYTFGKVSDGTSCQTAKATKGLCVNGRCLRLSCDGRLGGSAEEDMCRVCGGVNETCTRHRGAYHTERLVADQPNPGQTIGLPTRHPLKKPKESGYQEVTKIPKGSTNILVFENSSNFLALKSGEKFLLNGNWLIDWPGQIEALGTTFSYLRKEDQSESLASIGPTNEDVVLMALLREHNPGIFYEYWIPKEPAGASEGKVSRYSHPPKLEESVTNETNNSLRKLNLLETGYTTKADVKQAVLTANHNEAVLSTSNISSSNLLISNSVYGGGANTKLSSKTNDKYNRNKGVTKENKDKNIYKGARDFPNNIYNKNGRGNSFDSIYASKNSVHNEYFSKTKNTKIEKRKKGKKRRRPSYCGRCRRRRKAKFSFCTSDFVSLIEVLNTEEGGEEGYQRAEVRVFESYKNKIPLLHKEFLWLHPCLCRVLRTGKSYVVMGNNERRRSNELRLVLRKDSFVRRYSPKVVASVIKIRNHEVKQCRQWRENNPLKYYFTKAHSQN